MAEVQLGFLGDAVPASDTHLVRAPGASAFLSSRLRSLGMAAAIRRWLWNSALLSPCVPTVYPVGLVCRRCGGVGPRVLPSG